jgi:hypothetical protein
VPLKEGHPGLEIVREYTPLLFVCAFGIDAVTVEAVKP